MATPDRPGSVLRRTLPAAALALLLVTPAHALRVVNWNLTNYPTVLLSTRQPYMRAVMTPLEADVVVSQELLSQAGVDSFVTNVLNVVEPGEWAAAPFVNGNDTDNALFYKTARVQFLGGWSFYPYPTTPLRLVNVYRLKPAGYSGAAAEFRVYSQHLKASSGSSNEAQRYNEAIGIRDSMNQAPAGTAMILCGDFNIYKTSENAYKHFLRSLADNDGQVEDLKNTAPDTTSWTWNNSAFAALHTQCPCLTCPSGSGFSGGGLDDRFDMFLTTYDLSDDEGLDLMASTMVPVGNDAQHYNLNITDAPTIPEGAGYATALWYSSDHLPVRVDLQLPARGTFPASLAFGAVIVGATAEQPLAVSNASSDLDVLDELTYTMSASSGFTAPSGTQTLAEGGATSHTITMATTAPGVKSGSVAIASDDPDHLGADVILSGTVLDHAQASLDSLTALLGDTLDFGEHLAGEFAPLLAAVHNRDYTALRAQLAVGGAAITGGAGRFSIADFTATLVGGTAARWSVSFDDDGATTDSTYTATLTFTSADEPLPGATAQPDLSLALLARVSRGSGGAEPTLPALTRLYPPMPNPLTSGSTLRFDLARPTGARLEIFDLSGRRVALLADRELEPGRYSLRWDGRGDAGGALRSGIYFVRLSMRGAAAQTVRLAIVR